MPTENQESQVNITAIRPLKREGWFSVLAAGRCLVRLHQRRIEELGLAVGTAWTGELAARATRMAQRDDLYRQAIARINRRNLSRAEMRAFLLDRGADESLAEGIVNDLEKSGAIDDRALAEAVVHDATRRRPAGSNLLRIKLQRRGIDPDALDPALEAGVANESEAARQLMDQFLGAELARLDTAKRGDGDQAARARAGVLRRLAGLLARRGFEPDTVESLLEEAADRLAT